MSEKTNGKSISFVAVIIVIIILLLAVFGIYNLVISNNWKYAKKAEDIVINDNDSDDVKLKKIQSKIELLNEDIEKIQEELNTELNKMNTLYEEYVSVMNEYQIGAPVTDETTKEE